MVHAAQHVIELLSDILVTLTGGSSPGQSPPDEDCLLPCFCRVAVYPGLEVPWDSCETDSCDGCDGQLWGALQGVTPVPGSQGGGCEAWVFSAQVGAVRCAAKPGEDGSPPSVEAVQADAIAQAIDADGILHAIKCCPSRTQRVKDAGIVATTWVPLGPQGGCVGGAWTIQGRFDVCC